MKPHPPAVGRLPAAHWQLCLSVGFTQRHLPALRCPALPCAALRCPRGQLGRGFADSTPQPQPDPLPTSAENPTTNRGSIFEAEKIVLPSGLAAKHVSAGGRKDSGHTSIVDVDGGYSKTSTCHAMP